MSNNIANAINSRFRMTGMASGLDTDSIVQQLMRVERMKVDKVKQDRQALLWKRDDYRSMTTMLTGFKNDFFNVLKPASDMRSLGNYKQFSVTSSNSSAVSAVANASAAAGTHTITATRLATAASATSSGPVAKALESSSAVESFVFSTQDFNVTLNGVTKNIKLNGDYKDIAGLQSALQTSIDAAFGTGKIAVAADNITGKLAFTAANSRVSLTSGATDALAQLKITSGASNKLNLQSKLNVINTANPLSGVMEFNINGVDFSFDTAVKTMNDFMAEINSSAANVTLQYSELTDTFTLSSKTKGAGNAVNITGTAENLTMLANATGITKTTIDNGVDAKFNMDGQNDILRSDNTFTIDGVSYTLNEINKAVTVTINENNEAVFDKIKTFVDKYNEIVDKINSEISEERDRNYLPLTDEQREAMSDDEIEKWEEKAKAGMLRGDSTLSSMLVQMRNAMYSSIEGISGGIYSIGIKTGEYTQKGKLIIDEAKLKDAIKNKPDLVANIFTKESEVKYSVNLDSASRTKRYNENGIVQRLHDILQAHTTIVPDSDGHRGLLIEKAGNTGDYIDISSVIGSQIMNKDTLIDDLTEKLNDKEDRYYRQFAALEKAMSAMNSQSAWLTQQFSGGQY